MQKWPAIEGKLSVNEIYCEIFAATLRSINFYAVFRCRFVESFLVSYTHHVRIPHGTALNRYQSCWIFRLTFIEGFFLLLCLFLWMEFIWNFNRKSFACLFLCWTGSEANFNGTEFDSRLLFHFWNLNFFFFFVFFSFVYSKYFSIESFLRIENKFARRPPTMLWMR